MELLICFSGVFSLILGILHFFFPILFDFENAIPKAGEKPLKPFRLLFIQYPTKRSDVLGIAWVMNHCVSFVLVTIGIVDLCFLKWENAQFAPYLTAWIGLWWMLRAGSQLYLGQRRGDWHILFAFASLGVIHFFFTITHLC
jgi:hypothetical protein